jgi:signal transduction histidine kinase
MFASLETYMKKERRIQLPLTFFCLANNKKTNHILKFVILPSIFLSFIALKSTNSSVWITTSIDHYYIELFGTFLAGILAFYYISRSHNLNEKFSLFIGIGFLVNSLIDLFHVIVSLLNMNDILFLKYFIPQTWFAGRLFLSAMLAITIVRYISLSSTNISNIQQQQQISSSKINKNKISKVLLLYLIIAAFLASIVATSSLFIIFPFSVIDNIPIHRLYEFFPLTLFLISLYYFYKNEIHKNKDILYASILLSIVVDIFGQIIMSYSAYNFDTAHGIAHILKDSSYFINVIGLALSSIQYNRELMESNRRLRKSNELLNQQYKKVKESEKMKEEFINIAAHEFRTPIQPIIGLVENIYNNSKDGKQKELLKIVLRNAKRLKRLTNNVLDVTRIESNSLNLNKEKLNLDDLISKIIKDYTANRIKQKNVTIVYDYQNKTNNNNFLFVQADKDRLIQVICNLVDNALKNTTSSNQLITISIEKKGEQENKKQVIVNIKDTGEGIPENVLPKLFTKLTIGTSSSGTGLGLYICKNIVEAHGGKIWAENNSDGKGAIFKFTLPIAD